MKKYIISLDSGSSSCKASLIDQNGKVNRVISKPIETISPNSGWFMHSAKTMVETQISCLKALVDSIEPKEESVIGIAITNQRESVVCWDSKGNVIYDCISWRDSRGVEKNLETPDFIRKETGLFLKPQFSAPKMKWIVDQCFKKKIPSGVHFGTVDSWLLWNLTKGKSFMTDKTNASRTLLFNIHTLAWSQNLLDYFGIKEEWLPQVVDSTHNFGKWNGIPIVVMIGDQQASLFASKAAKCTYGTGAFLMCELGGLDAFKEIKDEVLKSDKLLISISSAGKDKPTYLVEGGVMECHSLLHTTSEDQLPTLDNVTKVSQMVCEYIKEMQNFIEMPYILADGGFSNIYSLINIQSQLSGVQLFPSKYPELTTLGAAMLAGMELNFFSEEQLIKIRKDVKSKVR